MIFVAIYCGAVDAQYLVGRLQGKFTYPRAGRGEVEDIVLVVHGDITTDIGDDVVWHVLFPWQTRSVAVDDDFPFVGYRIDVVIDCVVLLCCIVEVELRHGIEAGVPDVGQQAVTFAFTRCVRNPGAISSS